jgi:DNA repair photolyase
MKTTVIYEPRGRAREYSALAANLYSGCNHGCKYCYAPACLRRDRESFYKNPAKRKNIIEQLTKDCQELEGKCEERILLCFTCDPYQELEQELRITRAALELFYIYNLSFQVLTKAGTKAERDFDLYKPGDAFATTLTFMDEKKSLYYEPNAALPHDRIQAIKIAKAQGIETWVSFEPVLNTKEVFKLLDATHEYVDLYKVGKVSNFQTDEPIDWKRFGHEMVNRLEKLGKKYYIKKDLQKYM